MTGSNAFLAEDGEAAAGPRATYMRLLTERPYLFTSAPGGVQIIIEPHHIAAIEAEVGARYAARGQPRAWAQIGLHYEDPYIQLLRDAVIFPDGSAGIHHRILRTEGAEPSAVAMLPILGGKIVLIRHFRHPTRQWHWEIPRGAIEHGHDELTSVSTELMEELGATHQEAMALGILHGATGLFAHCVRLYAVKLSKIGHPARGEGIVDINSVTPSELEQMIFKSEITDAFTVGAYFHAKLRGIF